MIERLPDDLLPAVRRARIDRLDIYEVSETELQLLERGSPDSIFLNFSIFLLSVGASFLISLLTSQIVSRPLFDVFVIVTVVTFISGFVLLALWQWHRKSSLRTFEDIRQRMPAEGVPAKIVSSEDQ